MSITIKLVELCDSLEFVLLYLIQIKIIQIMLMLACCKSSTCSEWSNEQKGIQKAILESAALISARDLHLFVLHRLFEKWNENLYWRRFKLWPNVHGRTSEGNVEEFSIVFFPKNINTHHGLGLRTKTIHPSLVSGSIITF